MPARSHAVPCPVPVPNSRRRPPGFDAASTARSDPTLVSDIMVNDRASVSATMSAMLAGWRENSVSFITTRRTLSLFERREALRIRGARVIRARADQAVVRILLEDMGGPAGDAAHREDRRVEIDGDSHRV